MSTRTASLGIVLALATAGCADRAPDDAPATFPAPEGLAGVYDGLFPCENCREIAASLWLRGDETFFLRQSIVDDDGNTESSSYSFGRWHWDETSGELVLAARGPERRLRPLDASRLLLRTASPVEHVLARDASDRPFTDRVVLEGESTLAGSGATFVQCVTRLEWPVAETGAYRELRRQHRTMNPSGRIAATTVEGHLTTVVQGDAAREVLVVDGVVDLIKPGKACE